MIRTVLDTNIVVSGLLWSGTTPSRVVASDPDDDVFIACALSGSVKIIVSGDPHLLEVRQYADIQIVTAAAFLNYLADESGRN